MTANVTAFMWTHNEAHRLERTLMRLRPFVKRLVVADNGSTDGSVAIAQRWADEVYPMPLRPLAERSSPFVIEQGEWLLGIDADEELTDECSQGLEHMTSDPAIATWDLLRLSRVYYRDRVEQTEVLHHLRLFRYGATTAVEGHHTMPRPITLSAHRLTSFLAMVHDKADWEQRLDVLEYAKAGTLGPDAQKVMERWSISPAEVSA